MLDKLHTRLKPIYRKIASRKYQRRLDQMCSEGLPDSYRAPLTYLLNEKLCREEQERVNRIEEIRSTIAARGHEIAGVYQSPDTDPSIGVAPGPLKDRTFERIANVTSIKPRWGTFLYLCASRIQAKTILELGGCAGISGCYMSSSTHCEHFITIEGSAELAKLAETSLAQIASNASVVNMLFDDGLDQILPSLEAGLDMVHIDGQHEKLATLHYFERVIPYLNTGALIVFDDIHWSPGMWEAWKEIREHKGLAYTISLDRSGICIWQGGEIESKQFDFSI